MWKADLVTFTNLYETLNLIRCWKPPKNLPTSFTPPLPALYENMSALSFLLTVITSIAVARVCCKTVNTTTPKTTNSSLTSTLKPTKLPSYHETNLTYHFRLASLLINGTIYGTPNPLTLTNYTTPQNSTNSTDDDPRARIIGGEPAYEGEFKYQLSIRLFRRHHCGASLITVDEVQLAITAAHCVREALPEDLTLVAGDLTRSDITGREQERQVVDVVKHENFEFIEGVPSYDIALLFIEKPFQENSFVGSIGLPRDGQETKGKVVVSGWGDDNPRFAGRPSDKLMKVEVPIVETASCKRSYAFIVDEFYDHFMCAGYMMRGVHKDSCQGDSGGPVRAVDGGYLAGIVSWGAGCGIPQFPGVNTKVSYFIEWINDNVRRFKTDSSSEEESREEEEEGEDNDLHVGR